MITISCTNFRKQTRKYIDLMIGGERIVVLYPNDVAVELVQQENISDAERFFSTPKNKEKIDRAIKQLADGTGKSFSAEDLKKMFQ